MLKVVPMLDYLKLLACTARKSKSVTALKNKITFNWSFLGTKYTKFYTFFVSHQALWGLHHLVYLIFNKKIINTSL
jgi:hypothetical protein